MDNNTAVFEVEGVGEFEILLENTIYIEDQINLKLLSALGEEYVKIQENLSNLRRAIIDRLMKENFPKRKVESLIKEELEALDKLFREDESNEKSVYVNLAYSLSRTRFYYEFPVICKIKPKDFDIQKITDPAIFDKIFDSVVEARKGSADKKKSS